MNPRIQLTDLKRSWTPPDGLDHSRPREVRLTAGGRALAVLAIALMVGAIGAGIAVGSMAAGEAEEARLLREEGVTAQGLVIRIWRSRGEKKRPWIAYQFLTEGRAYGRDTKVPLSVWQSLRVGSEIPVRYVPSKPDLNYPLNFAKKPTPVWLAFLIAGSLAVLGFMATLPILKARRLLSEGRPAPAIVTRHGKIMRSSHGAVRGRKFYYEFPLLSGATARGESGPSKNPPVVGSALCALYDPETPRNNAPYPLSLVRLANTNSLR